MEMGREHRRAQAPAAWRGRWGTWVGKPEGPPGQEFQGVPVVVGEAGAAPLGAALGGGFAAVNAAKAKAMGTGVMVEIDAHRSSFTWVSIPVFSFQKLV